MSRAICNFHSKCVNEKKRERTVESEVKSKIGRESRINRERERETGRRRGRQRERERERERERD